MHNDIHKYIPHVFLYVDFRNLMCPRPAPVSTRDTRVHVDHIIDTCTYLDVFATLCICFLTICVVVVVVVVGLSTAFLNSS